MIVNLVRNDPENLGDLYSHVSRYTDIPMTVRDVYEEPQPCEWLIVGGGGLFYFDEVPAHIANANRVILWGCGTNDHYDIKKYVLPIWAFRGGLRGWRDSMKESHFGVQWVPCPSCLLPHFLSMDQQVQHEYVQYHTPWFKPINGIPSMTSDTQDIDAVLAFLASGETILTSSYHGAYWATLLGKKVVVLKPWSSKFHFFKHPPVLEENPRKWRQAAQGAEAYPEALTECRGANRRFEQQVKQLITQTT